LSLKLATAPVKTMKAGQAIKAHGVVPTCPAGAAVGGGIILFTPACRFVGDNDKAAISAAAAIMTRRIARPHRLQIRKVSRERRAGYVISATSTINLRLGVALFGREGCIS
jgi:hypothetical protein